MGLFIGFFLVAFFQQQIPTSSSTMVDDYGGHSRDYKLLEDDGVSDWEKVATTTSSGSHLYADEKKRLRRQDVPSLKEIQEYINTFKSSFESATKVIKNMVNHSAVLTGRLKSAGSIQEKLTRKNTTLKELNDVIGLRLTCQTVNTTLAIMDIINKSKDFIVTEVNCYGMCPGDEKYRDTGYRRIHLIILIQSGKKHAELQLGTPYTNMWADWSHDFIYKGPKSFSADVNVKNYSLSMADYFWQLDEVRRNLPPCPSIMKNANPMDILKNGTAASEAEETYKKLGYPPNACYWWNDMKLALPDKTSPKCSNSSSSSTLIIGSNTLLAFIILMISLIN